MKRKTIARLIAVLLVGYGFAFIIMSADGHQHGAVPNAQP